MGHKNPPDHELTKEFFDFMEGDESPIRHDVQEKILARVFEDLNPMPLMVFLKVGLVQLVVGFVVLLFCPQFGFSLTGVHGIMHFFMRFGDEVCMAACGTIFVGSSLLLSAFLLNPDDLRVLHRNRVMQVSSVSLLGVGAFFCLGASVFNLMTVIWIGGAVAGGIASLELGIVTRRWLKTREMYA